MLNVNTRFQYRRLSRPQLTCMDRHEGQKQFDMLNNALTHVNSSRVSDIQLNNKDRPKGLGS